MCVLLQYLTVLVSAVGTFTVCLKATAAAAAATGSEMWWLEATEADHWVKQEDTSNSNSDQHQGAATSDSNNQHQGAATTTSTSDSSNDQHQGAATSDSNDQHQGTATIVGRM